MLRAFISSILIQATGLPLPGEAAQVEASDPGPHHEATLKAVTACDVPAANVRITYVGDFQSDVVRISDLGGVGEARLRCVKDAVDPTYIVWIEAEEQRFAYYKLAEREDRRSAKREAVPWLKARGMLGRVPSFDSRKGLEAFARGLETACSIRPGRALEAHDASTLVIRRGFFGKFMAPKAYDEFTCLSRMFAASNADKHDILLGFIGNEAPSAGRP